MGDRVAVEASLATALAQAAACEAALRDLQKEPETFDHLIAAELAADFVPPSDFTAARLLTQLVDAQRRGVPPCAQLMAEVHNVVPVISEPSAPRAGVATADGLCAQAPESAFGPSRQCDPGASPHRSSLPPPARRSSFS